MNGRADAAKSVSFARPDSYAAKTGLSADGWPLANYGATSLLTHCYSMVGVARDLAPSTGSGAELYTVIGQRPRPLDRNSDRRPDRGGHAWLSSLPRGTAQLGVYAKDQALTPILGASRQPAA